MPFTDPVSSVSGRNSRASNVSGVTGASQSVRSQRMAVPPSDTLNAGVLSMLKTTTDTGDIGALSFNSSRLPNMPRATHQRRGHHTTRLSGGSGPSAISSHHHYPSQTSRVSSAREWDSMSNQRRGSLTSLQSMPPSLPPVHLAKGPLQMPPSLDRPRDSRSYSLTSAPPVPQLPRHRSQTSLKSQGHEPRQPPYARAGPPPPVPMQDNRPPYVYPTRLKRPGYRSPSPALSDTYAQGPPPPMLTGPPMAARRPPPIRPPPQTYNSDYGAEYGSDPRHLNVRGPPPRAVSNSPAMGYPEHPQQDQLPYRHPMAMRSAPGLATGPYAGHPPPPGAYPAAPHGHTMHQPPMMHRPPYAGPMRPHYPPGPGYTQYALMGHPHGSVRGPPPSHPNPQVAPAAHNLFHNAARMARHLPHRTDTPMTESGPPSSDPPSSGTAPTSSSPPTPRDQTSIQVVVDPAFIDPALADLQDSSSEPVLPHQYFEYADGLVEKDIADTEIDIGHPSVPPTGLVQRVRAMLESKAAAETAAKHEIERERSPQPQIIYEEDIADLHVEMETEEIHELAAEDEYRFTVVEEFDAPAELPASPVKIAELGGSPIRIKRRITREMVKAELRPSSVDNTVAFEIDATDEDIAAGIGSPPKPSQRSHETRTIDPFSDVIKTEDDQPSTPGPVKAAAPVKRSPESATTSSPETLGISTVDYANRFSTAVESTGSSEHTRSKDPFVLDADTITLQHQRSKEKVNKTEQPTEDPKDLSKFEPRTELEAPVSPLLTGEDVSRKSAVSPLRTQTLGIDETLHMASEGPNDEATDTSAELTVPDTSEALPPPTPRTPKTYSKSVQLQPNSSLVEDDTPNSNRLSLPPDLSTIGDTSVNTTSDMVTDVAVRFSLPSTTVTVTKPQIIEIPPSSSPPAPPPKPKPAMYASDSKSKRNSVTFADELVPPLQINKQSEQYPLEQRPSDSRINKGKAIICRPSPLQENIDARVSRDATIDFRFSNMHGINNRFGSTHLPGLKEESVEEMSISNKHASDRMCKSEFPLPARIAAVKAMQERRLQESAEKAKARRAHRHPNRPLAETRDLPSLNFSRMDLIDKLNEALEVRSSKSMEVMRRREFCGIYSPSPQRPQSTEPFRDRYTSFFSKPEDFSSFFDAMTASDEEEESSTRPASPKDTGVPTVEVQPSTEVDFEESGSRPLSPEDFLSVATQVERLSIPSVAGLSERLSEILPNLHDLQLDKVLSGFSSVPDDLGKLDEMRPGTVLSTRTSAGFRTLAERAEEIVNNGAHDSTVPTNRLLAHKELTGLLPSASADQVSALITNDNKASYLSGSTSAPTDLGMEPLGPESVLTFRKSPTCIEEVNQLLPPEMNPITRNAKRALISSGSSRPWNQDENYPWAGTKVDVDLSAPSEARTRDSLMAEAVRRRKTKSLDLNSADEPTDTSKGIDIGSILEHDTVGDLTDEQLTGVQRIHTRKQSKRSLIGSITKKIGLGGGSNNTTRTISSPVASASDVRSSQPHRPGERYPTSSLTPPAAFNLDEVRSYFSDDSSEKERNASLRKRLTNFRSKGKSVRLQSAANASSYTPEQPRTQSAVDVNTTVTTYDAGSTSMAVGDRLMGASSSANTYDAVGMGKAEFRIKRFGEKLRHLVAKSGELIRTWSQRSRVSRVGSRNERVRDDWLSDSLYSGV